MEHLYKFKFYINARHSVSFDGVKSEIHPHTWETVIFIKVKSNNFINFTKIEKYFEKYFDQFEGKYLNDLEYFNGVQPTMENIGKRIFSDINGSLNSNRLILSQLEISENPTRTYIIKQ